MAQHTILQAKQERLGITDTSLELEYAKWWSLADLLIQLGETGSLDGNSSGGLSSVASAADTRRERRITLAADKVLPPSHLSRLADDNATSPASSILGIAPMLSDSLEITKPTSPSIVNGRIGGLWRASTGRNDFSSSQLEQLRAILDVPKMPTVDSAGEEQPVGLPPMPAGAQDPTHRRGLYNIGSSKGQIQTAQNSHRMQTAIGLAQQMDVKNAVTSQRRPSRSTMGTIRDFWRGTGETQRAGPSAVQHKAPTRQHIRPSLGSIFRKSSSRVTVHLYAGNTTAVTKTTKDLAASPAYPAPPSVAASDDASQSSSVSDWDTPPPEDRHGAAIRARTLDQRQSDLAKPFQGSAANEKTITRSDSRKMLAVLGKGHALSAEGLSISQSPLRPEFHIPAYSPKPRDPPELEPLGEKGLTLTPASLPALVDKLKDVTDHCREHLDAASRLLKARPE